MTGPFRRLPSKLMYRGLELSIKSEKLLEEAMIRLNVNDPEEAVQTALRAFLEQAPPNREPSV